mmetsp:Transcript_19165/g.46264  ORF Transcript_19165/g.46264 Transcript_19165/m.46264 type:complete len:695 (+) Transcript_19165:363-2447(+)
MTETQDHYFNRRDEEDDDGGGGGLAVGGGGGGTIDHVGSIGTPTASNTKSTTTAAAFDNAITHHHHHQNTTDLFDENECYLSALGGGGGGRRGREGDDLLMMNLMSNGGLPLQKKRRTCGAAISSPVVGSAGAAGGVSAAASVSSSSSLSEADNETMKMTNETSSSSEEQEQQDNDDIYSEIEIEPTTVTFPRNYEQLGDLYAAMLTNVKDENLAGIVDNVRDLCQMIAITTSTTNNTRGGDRGHDGYGYGYGRGPTSSSRTRGGDGSFSSSISSTSVAARCGAIITPNTTIITNYRNHNSYGYSSSNNNPNSNHDGWSSLPQSLEIPSLSHGQTMVDGFDCGDDVDMMMDGSGTAGTTTSTAGFSDHFQACSILLSLGCHKTIIDIMKKNPDYSQLQYYCTRVLTEFLWVPTATYASSSSKPRFDAADATVIDGESYCYHPYIGSNIMEVDQDDDETRWESSYGMSSRSMTMKTTSGRDEVYNAGGCTTVLQIFRRGSLESDTNLQKAACQFLWTLLSSPSSPRGPQSSNRFVVEKFIRSTDDLSTLLYLALGRLCMSGGSSISAVGTMDKHQVVMDTATDLIQLVVAQCPVHLRSSAALYIHQYCRKMASRNEPHLEDSHFADWAVYNNDLFGRSTRLMKWIQEVQEEDGGWSIGDAGVCIMDADEVSYAADDFPPSSARHGFQRDEQYMME